jgi:tetratricopeptide (TPR) repeat protein
MNFTAWWLTGLSIGTNVVLVQQAVVAKSPQEVARIAKNITVAIKTVGTSSVGSGILLQQQADVYTVLTAGHVVNKPQGVVRIKTVDGQVHQAIAGSVRMPGSKLDLAVLKFRSSNKYTLVKIGTSNTLEELSPIYVAGFPAESTSRGEVVIEGETFTVTDGKVLGKATKGNEKGYSLIYSNITRPGMSGGPVLNEAGELVAIHGQGDREDDGNGGKTGLNLGIVVERFGAVEVSLGVRSEQQIAVLLPSTQLNAADYFVTGNDKYGKGDFRGALADFNQAIVIDPSNYLAYNNRGFLKYQRLNDLSGALSDYNRAISLDPSNYLAYNNRGLLKSRNPNDVQGALSDYNRAISLDPSNYFAYNNRGLLKSRNLNDVQGALADLSKAIKINPRITIIYYNRGNLLYSTDNIAAAIQDFRQLLVIDSSGDLGLISQGIIEIEQGSYSAAIKNFTQVARFTPDVVDIYKYRGIAYQRQGKRSDAIADWRKAVQLYKYFNSPKDYEIVRGWLQNLGAFE